MANSIDAASPRPMCVLCRETDFADHQPCPLSVEAAKIRIEADKVRIEADKLEIEADKVKKNHEVENKKIFNSRFFSFARNRAKFFWSEL